MSEDVDINWDEVIDYRFLEIEAELSVLSEYSQAVERQLPLAIQVETERLELELKNADEYEQHTTELWIYQFTEEVLPRFFRAPILIALWAIFESAVLKIAGHLQKEQRLALGVDDLRGRNDFDKYQKYYEHVLGFPLIELEGMQEHLVLLLAVRNALAHSNGRVEMIKSEPLKRIRSGEKTHQGISSDSEYLSVTAEFVESMQNAVTLVLEDLIARVRKAT